MKVKDLRSNWCSEFPWVVVETLNRELCQQKNAFHGPTSDGYEEGKALWEERFADSMTLLEATAFLRKMHRTAPFCFFNGNTFVTIIRDSITALSAKLPGGEAIALRTGVGHCVAGTMSPAELEEIIDSLPEVELP